MSNTALKLGTAQEIPSDKIFDIIDRITAIASDAGLYLNCLLDGLKPYVDADQYCNEPQLVEKCFVDGLKNDINEIINTIQNTDEQVRRKLLDMLRELLETVRNNPVFYFYTKQICDFFKIFLPGTVNAPTERATAKRYSVCNQLLDLRRREKFLRACGLVPKFGHGKGSHTVWVDAKTLKFIGSSTRADKVWLPGVINDLLKNGLPLDRIADACNRLQYEFRILQSN